jgi:hypothetical protein
MERVPAIDVSNIHPIMVTGFRAHENNSLVGGGRVSRTTMDLFAFCKIGGITLLFT